MSEVRGIEMRDPHDEIATAERFRRFAQATRPTAPREHISHLDRAYDTPRHRQGRPKRRHSGWSFRDYALAGSLMTIVSAITGIAVYDRMENGILISEVRDRLARPATQPSAVTRAETVTVSVKNSNGSKQITTAKLNVADVSGALNTLIPLSLDASSGTDGPQLAFRLSGMPESAYLTAGNKSGIGGWLLKPGEADNVKLVVPKAPASSFAIGVAAIEAVSGELVSPVVEMNVALDTVNEAVVLPVAATIHPLTNFNSETPDDATKIIQDGDRMMDAGDIEAARSFYTKALALGDSRAALQLGKSYDPSTFVERKILRRQPDPVKAMEFYQQAAEAGIDEARAHLEQLQARLAR